MKTKLMFAALAMIAVSSVACVNSDASAVTSENRPVGSNFYGLILRAKAQVILSQGKETSVRIEGDKKSISSIETSVENGALVINGKAESPVTVYVTLDEISLIEVEGSGRIFSSNIINSDMLLLKVVGSGSIHADVRCLSIGMIVRGNGKISVEGSTGDSYTRVLGNGQVIARNLDAIRTSAEIINRNASVKLSDSNRHSVLKLHQ